MKPITPKPRRETHHYGYTLIELLVSIGSASLLMAGLSSALFVSSRALDVDNGATHKRLAAASVLDRLTADVRSALWFTEQSATVLEFTVPDRDNDSQAETLRYTWSGVSGAPLLRSLNGGVSVTVLDDVRSLNFDYFTRSASAIDVTVAPDPTWPVVESFSTQAVASNTTNLSLPLPAGTMSGELLIAALAIDKDAGVASPPAGWSLLDYGLGDANRVTLGVWWKLAGGAEPAASNWSWENSNEVIGWVVRISNQYAGNPVTSMVPSSGNLASPECATTSSVLDDSLVLRLGGFDHNDINLGDPGLASHTPLLMEHAGGKVSGGCGYRVLRPAGSCGTATFTLTGNEEYRTVTLIIAPMQD